MKTHDIFIEGAIIFEDSEREFLPKGQGFYSLDKFKEDFAAVGDAEAINVFIDTPGGNTTAGFDMYQTLKNCGKKVTTIAYNAHSIGSIIFLSGSERLITENLGMVIHNAWFDAKMLEGYQLNQYSLMELLDESKSEDAKILSVYTSVSGKDKESEIAGLMANETNITASKAIELGFATGIYKGASKAVALKKGFSYSKRMMYMLTEGAIKTYADCIVVNQDRKFLLLQRKQDDEFEPNTWGFPGGKVMQGETIREGAIRELYEETGIQAKICNPIAEIVNEDESSSHYFIVGYYYVENENQLVTPEHKGFMWATIEEISNLNVIKNQADRYLKLIKSKFEMEKEQVEKLNALEKGFKALLNLFKGSMKNLVVDLADGQKVFVFTEDGEVEGKRAVMADAEGNPTETNAPAGNHPLNDGRTITVGEDGVITAVSEGLSDRLAAMEKEKEDMTAKLAMTEKEKEDMQAKLNSYEEEKKQISAQMTALKAEFDAFKKEVPGDTGKNKYKADTVIADEEYNKLPKSKQILLNALNRNK